MIEVCEPGLNAAAFLASLGVEPELEIPNKTQAYFCRI